MYVQRYTSHRAEGSVDREAIAMKFRFDQRVEAACPGAGTPTDDNHGRHRDH